MFFVFFYPSKENAAYRSRPKIPIYRLLSNFTYKSLTQGTDRIFFDKTSIKHETYDNEDYGRRVNKKENLYNKISTFSVLHLTIFFFFGFTVYLETQSVGIAFSIVSKFSMKIEVHSIKGHWITFFFWKIGLVEAFYEQIQIHIR